MGTALVIQPQLPAPPPRAADFNLPELRVFTTVPDHRDIGVATLHGLVVVYDRGEFEREGVQEGAFYVRESQHTNACRDFSAWLRSELKDFAGQAQPFVPLRTSREVVRAIRWPREDHWAVRLSSGFVDGPYEDWSFGRDFVGKVVGVYRPEAGRPN